MLKDSSANATDAYGYSIARVLEDEIGMPLDDADKRKREVGIFAVTERLGVLEDDNKRPIDGGPGIVFIGMTPKAFL